MHPTTSEFDWPKLRRELEEILSIIKSDHRDEIVTAHGDAPAIPYQSETTSQSKLADDSQLEETDALFNDALLVLTEFGQASPSILQMWLSIDYARSVTMINRFQNEGLISSKGRVRHKAFLLRRSIEQQA